MKRVYAILPLDLLNIVGSYIGDDYHYLTFDLTPQRRWLTPCRMFMQSRTNPRRKSRKFHYGYFNIHIGEREETHVLVVLFGAGTIVREKYCWETKHDYNWRMYRVRRRLQLNIPQKLLLKYI